MTEIDIFANQLLEEAKRFLEKSGDSADSVAQAANLHASLMLAFCALEAHLNAIGEEFSIQGSLSAHEKGMLLEKDVRLEEGEFQVTPHLKMARLEDRIEFMHRKFSGKPIERDASSWRSQLSEAIGLRNQLTHAREVPAVSETAVRRAVQAIIETLDALYMAIYQRKFPPAGRGVHSRLSF